MSTLSMTTLARLVDAAASIVAETELPVVLKRVAETAKELTGAHYAALGVIGEYGLLTEFIHAGMDRHTAERIGQYPTGKGILGLLIREGQTIRLDNIDSHPDSVGFPSNHPPMQNFLGVPVRVGAAIFGNIYLTQKPDGFSSDDEATVEALAVIAGAAVGTSRLRERLERLAVAGERERIARDVHDSIVQDLFAVGLSLQMASSRVGDETLVQELDRIADQIDRSITSLRSLILDLRAEPSPLDLFGSLESAVAGLAPSGGPNLEIQISRRGIVVEESLLEDIVAVAKEGASNALRHAGASEVRIRVDQAGASIVVSVIDDGVGFDPSTSKRGMGLNNIEARAAGRGGTVDITSGHREGTILEVVLPLNER